MKQVERIIKLAELDAEVRRMKVKVEEAQGRLSASKAHRDQIAKSCTHKDGIGRSMAQPSVFGIKCTICGERVG